MFATKSMTSPRQTHLCRSNGIWSITIHGESWRQSLRHSPRKSATQIMKVGDVICIADFHDLCPRLSPQGSFGKRRNVGEMEFGLKQIQFNSVYFCCFVHASKHHMTISPAVTRIADRTGCQWPSRSSKINSCHVIWKPICVFLLVINSNLGPIFHRF